MKNFDLCNQLKPGRHYCDCQARNHGLIRNCLSCGKIVCEQEGSGQCFNCNSLVCTREEQEILKKNDKKSFELLKKLTKNTVNSISLKDLFLNNSFSIHELNANKFKNKLLIADKDNNQSKVNDLESDYYQLEHNIFLSPEDRKLIIQRKNELEKIAQHSKKEITFDLDITNQCATEKKINPVETMNDPIIQLILSKSFSKLGYQTENEIILSSDLIKTFVPKYSLNNCFVSKIKNYHDEHLKLSAKKTMHIVLPELIAYDLITKKKSHLPWNNEIKNQGIIYISIQENRKSLSFNKSYSTTEKFERCSIVGQAFLDKCITSEDYLVEYSEEKNLTDGFVLLFKFQEGIEKPIPFLASSNFGFVENNVLSSLEENFYE